MKSGIVDFIGKLFPPLTSSISARLDSLNLSTRDRRTLQIGGAVAVVIVCLIVFQTVVAQNRKFESRIRGLGSEIEKIERLRVDYLESNQRLRQMASTIDKQSNESLLTIVEKVMLSSRIDRGTFSIKSRSPVASEFYEELSVGVEIKKISLGKVINVLYRLQTNRTFLKTSKFRLRTRFDNPDLTDVSFRVSHFKFFEDLL